MGKLEKGKSVTSIPEYSTPLKAADGSTVNLSEFTGQKAVVLFFYPKANTSVCTKEVCAFRDAYTTFEKHGAQVIGLSSDAPDKLSSFAKDQHVQYPLLSDHKGALRKAFGIKGSFLGVVPGRETFVIGKDGTVLHVFNDALNAKKHVDEALDVLSSQS